MVNDDLIVLRIRELMNKNNLTPSSFSKKIESKRANVSHILSGRNKPSLNFLIKIVNSFDNISLDWFVSNEEISLDEYKGTSDLDSKSRDTSSNKIKTIVHFYENGTFKIFKNSD